MPNFLIADDTPRKMDYLLSLLEKASWKGKILTADTCEGAIELINKHKIDAAFIDYYIPSTYGPSIIRHLKKSNPKARIALVSSADSALNAAEAKAAGAEATISMSEDIFATEKTLLELLNKWKS
ncbi:hypothetical protein A3J34_04595 [Candidatus Peribacteria bacterium RIFCSPLOWO2_02_FULL_51_10]|nr:MAG: hypothetical protein A3J34_04595 [Candidatus Peribacteria bacterium RIFCSPLOWO2_02_FULL_51_10]